MDISKTVTPALPAGALLDFAGSSAPSGYLLCDGSLVSRTTYARLFEAIGVAWGAGDGSTTFKLPDLRGRAAVGAGTGAGLSARSLAASGGEEAHQLTSAEMPSHTHAQNSHNHTINDPGHLHGLRGIGTGSIGGGGHNIVIDSGSPINQNSEGAVTGVYNSATTASNQNTGGDGTHNNMQPFAVVTKIIKF